MPAITPNRIDIRPFASLGHADHGWLDARHHFSFADYHDSARMGWGAIRVWNDDFIAAGSGFPPHAHADMEIITYVRSGAITHQDSLGNQGRTQEGDVQVMSAGTGIRHAEYNLETEPTSLFQIWIQPRAPGGSPSWGARPFPKGRHAGALCVLASGYDCDREALRIRANARLMGGTIAAASSITYDSGDGRHLYLVPASGRVTIDDQIVNARDGVAILGGQPFIITAMQDSEIVLVDSA